MMHTCIPRSFTQEEKSPMAIQLMRKRNMYFTKSKSSSSYVSKYKVLRNTVISKLRSARSDYFRLKRFWKAVSSLNRGNSRIPTLVSEDGEEASAPTFFFCKKISTLQFHPYPKRTYQGFLFIVTTRSSVLKLGSSTCYPILTFRRRPDRMEFQLEC